MTGPSRIAGPDTGGFDAFADRYSEALQQGLSVSGESGGYFARGRVEWLASGLVDLGVQPHRVLDYGCGTGTAAPFLRDILGAGSVVGVDVSERSIDHARRREGWADFRLRDELPAGGSFDVVYCNGVFHHIDPTHRPDSLRYIHDSLRPGGVFALWENNPWNPGTRLVMRRIPFDRDAITIAAPGARRLLAAAGFEVLSVDFLFIFPRVLAALRPLERRLARLPFGAQYQVLARRRAA